MKMKLLAASLCTLLATVATTASAEASTVQVLGSQGIWLAGQPTGTSVTGYFGSDTSLANSPVLISTTEGATLTFSATGTTSVDGSCFAGANGGCYFDESGFSPSPWSSAYNGPADALVGVFLSSAAPTIVSSGGYTGPEIGGPNGLVAGSTSPPSATNAPELDQIFIIGDGAGGADQFTAPSGASTLYIGVADALGGSTGNDGALYVTFTGGTSIAALPEPTTWALMILGLGGVGLGLRRRGDVVAPAI